MKITLFTSNQSRHNYLINKLSKISSELFVVQENDTLFPGEVPGHYPASDQYKNYFANVLAAQKKLFKENYISTKNIRLLPLMEGDVNKCSLYLLSDFLKSDIYIVTGSSFIKGDLAKLLIKKNALSIHMGVAPYYRGTDCNFWALFDNNPHLVGATIYKLSEDLDTGQILYHALSEIKDDPFIYTMSVVKSAFDSLVEKIKNNTILDISTLAQDKNNEIRYSRKKDFNNEIIEEFNQKKINLNSKKFDHSLFKSPFILRE